MFLHVSVILFTGGVSGQTPLPRADTPSPGQTPPPPWSRHTPQTRHLSPDQTPPPWSACWEIWATREQYASYWNAILLPPTTKLGQGYVFTGMCDSVHRGVSASVHAGIPPPWEQTPPPPEQTPRSRHPSEADTPRADISPGADTPLPGADTPGTEHAGRYGQRAGGTHPTGMQSCYYIGSIH